MSLDVKICGLKDAEAVAAALAGGATHLGFIFFPRSPRHVEPEVAGQLRAAAMGRAKAVAVTVDADDALLDRIVSGMQPDMLQLHGGETPERVSAVRDLFGLPVVKALSIAQPADLEPVAQYGGVADRLLFDAKAPQHASRPGGNGLAFDWSLLAAVGSEIDYLLSGGLNAANVKAALAQASPSGIDISSGVERAPGVKDPELIAAFFRALRQAEREGRAV